MKISTLQDLRDYILRKLGSPVQTIELCETQLDDCVDDAIQLFVEYHSDGCDIGYSTFEITDDTILQYPMNENTQLVLEIIKTNTFNYFPQDTENIAFTANDFNYPFSMRSDIVSVEVFRQKHTMIENQFKLPVIFDYNEITNILHIPAPVVGKYMLKLLKSPDDINLILNDPWLKKYSTALAKKQWAVNLQKFTGVQLAGGAEFNHDAIMTQALDEIEKAETDLVEVYSDILMPKFG